MRSEADSPPRPSLVRRVAASAAVAAAIGGALAALASAALAIQLIAAYEDRALLTTTAHLADEVREELEEEDDDTLAEALIDELDDVELPYARARIDGPTGWLAGARDLEAAPRDECRDASRPSHPARRCTVAMGADQRLTLETSTAASQARVSIWLWSALLGMLFGATAGGIATLVAATRGLRPLRTLAGRVRAVEPARPDPTVLDPPLRHAELETLRSAMVQLLEGLRSSLDSARSFSSNAAHELRTPLTTIVGELELLAEQATTSDARSIERVRRRVADLSTLVERLLILAQPGRLPESALRTIDLADVIDAVTESLPDDARARVRVDHTPDALLRGDESLLKALISNAISNALKFSSTDVRVWTTVDATTARLHVRDRGVGIAPNERTKVFEAFYRVQGAHLAGPGGHGVGLALIAHVARLHGGEAHLDDVDEGTLLVVDFPSWRPHRGGAREGGEP